MNTESREAQIAGLNEFARQRKEENRRALIEAAERVFNRVGYITPTVDDIAQEAGVSRQTFYRHFEGKLAIGMEYFARQTAISLPLWTRIAGEDFSDPAVVERWVTDLFDFNETCRNSQHTFAEMGTVEPAFVDHVKELLRNIIERLGDCIPAFTAARGEGPAACKSWTKAWLFLYQLRQQCSMNATGFMSENRRIVIEVFTESFLRLVAPEEPPRRKRKLAS